MTDHPPDAPLTMTVGKEGSLRDIAYERNALLPSTVSLRLVFNELDATRTKLAAAEAENARLRKLDDTTHDSFTEICRVADFIESYAREIMDECGKGHAARAADRRDGE